MLSHDPSGKWSYTSLFLNHDMAGLFLTQEAIQTSNLLCIIPHVPIGPLFHGYFNKSER